MTEKNLSQEQYSPERIRDKILWLFKYYPVMSRQMVQAGLGPHVSGKLWQPILQELIDEGKVTLDETVVKTPAGRHYVLTRLTLGQQVAA